MPNIEEASLQVNLEDGFTPKINDSDIMAKLISNQSIAIDPEDEKRKSDD